MTLREVRALARKRPEQEFALNRLYGAHVSPIFTVACLRLGLSPDQVTVIGGIAGVLGAGLLFRPIDWWSIAAIALLQIGYILDFSDGQVARITNRSSVAGSYLDWLTHFYVPVATALAVAASIAWESSSIVPLGLGTLAALELAAFTFSCKEHILISMLRNQPDVGVTAPFQAALRDDARPADVELAGDLTSLKSVGIAGRMHRGGLQSLVGEILIYPGSVHLVTLAVCLDLLLKLAAFPPTIARFGLLVIWALVLPGHLFLSARRNHRLLQVLEARIQETDGPL